MPALKVKRGNSVLSFLSTFVGITYTFQEIYSVCQTCGFLPSSPAHGFVMPACRLVDCCLSPEELSIASWVPWHRVMTWLKRLRKQCFLTGVLPLDAPDNLSVNLSLSLLPPSPPPILLPPQLS